MTAPVSFAGSGALTVAGVPAVTTAASALGGSGALSAQASAPVLLARDSSSFDSAGVSSNIVNLPVPATVQAGDFGMILVTWVPGSGTPAVSAVGWNVLIDSSGSTTSPFVILTRPYQLADGSSVEIDFSQSLLPTVVGTWYPGVARVDTTGLISARNGTSSSTCTASSVTMASSTGGMLVGFFVERSVQVGTIASVSHGAPKIFLEGSGASIASALIADSFTASPGDSADMVATYNTASGNGAGVLVSLLPTGAGITGFPRFKGGGSLGVTGAILQGNPFFAATGFFSAVGTVRSRVSLGGTGTLGLVPVFHGAVAFGSTGSISFIPTARPMLSAQGSLSFVGMPRKTGSVLLSATGTGVFTGAIRAIAKVAMNAAGTASAASSNPTMTGIARSVGSGSLAARGTPAYTVPIVLAASAALSVNSPRITASGHIDLSQTGIFSAQGISIRVGGSAGLFTDSTLQLVTHADLTPRGLVIFGAESVLSFSGGVAQISPVLITHQFYYVREVQDWAVEQERQRHIQAIYQVGEPVLFILMWKVEDYEAGLITKCPRCAENADSIDARIATVYQQPQTARCPFCFGTTFYGGVRAKVRRPAILTDADEDERKSSRGVTHSQSLTLQTTDDFRVRTGDFVFRRDGSRWQLGHPSRIMLRTGFAHPTQAAQSIGYAQIPVSLEDKSSVAYEIPPNPDELQDILLQPHQFPYIQ